MFKADYKHLYDQIRPSESLMRRTLQAANSNTKPHLFQKPAIILGLVCVCLFCSLPAWAASVEPVYQMMYLISPKIAQFFMPVQKADESDGIRMEVVSAFIHENIAEIYVTMQDLTGRRIDATTDLYDSYSINRPFDSSAYCERVGFDADTQTATFLIRIDEWGGQDIEGDKITFSVREFLSHKKQYEDIKIPIGLSAVTASNETKQVSLIGWSSAEPAKYPSKDTEHALIPSAPVEGFPVEGIALTGIGYVDGRLHIQTAVKNPLDNDNHGNLYLKDNNGNLVKCSYQFSFTNNGEADERIDYCESVFDIPQEKLSSYTLYGDFVTSGMKTEGDWRVTFPLENAK